jgi:hypothetical protein
VKVAALTGDAAPQGKKNWRATITATVTRTDGTPVAGATVSGSFTTGGTGSCTTGGNGICSLTGSAIKTSIASTTYNVVNVTGTGLSYEPAGSQTSVTVNRP